MSILINEQQQSFHLTNGSISYQFSVEKDTFLIHNYWGKAIQDNEGISDYPRHDRSHSTNPFNVEAREYSLNDLPQEFPTNGYGDFRETALEHRYPDGSFITQLKYDGYEVYEGKKALEGLPHTYVNKEDEAETLEIYLIDMLYDVIYTLTYTIFQNYDVITRHVRVKNNGNQSVEINKVLSMSLDFDYSQFDLIQLPGSWGRERSIVRTPITQGLHRIDSKRGTVGHEYQPFFALTDPTTTEHHGDIYGFHLVYSGEFMANIELGEFGLLRAQLGINSEHFNWELSPGETFQTPEAVLTYSSKGLNGLSQIKHRFYQNHLIRGKHQYEERPVVLNNWEGTYFNFTEEKIDEMTDEAAKLGVELFVLDDGWFGERNTDTTSLGDWFVNRDKLPSSLKTLAENIKAKGLKFGLWFEPEMISKQSQLYKQHPDWLLKAKDRKESAGRDQYILDYSQPAVRKNIVKQLKNILDNVPIDYIKWDYNRNMTEIGSQSADIRDGEVSHRVVLGLYEILEELTSSYPNILWESCSGGGGRYDPGMLYYMPQTWTSDNTDAVSRLGIQTGTSLIFPVSSMASHVSDVPNHQLNRTTSLKIRGDVAMSGNLGYELDVTTISDEEKAIMKEQISFYKEHRSLIQYGNFYRIINFYEASCNEAAWLFVNDNQSEGLFYYFKVLDRTNPMLKRVKLVGLNPQALYRINQTDEVRYGDELMNKGIFVENKQYYDEISDQDLHGDFRSLRIKLTQVK